MGPEVLHLIGSQMLLLLVRGPLAEWLRVAPRGLGRVRQMPGYLQSLCGGRGSAVRVHHGHALRWTFSAPGNVRVYVPG